MKRNNKHLLLGSLVALGATPILVLGNEGSRVSIGSGARAVAHVSQDDLPEPEEKHVKYKCKFFDTEIVVLDGVFGPIEAENYVLPLVQDHQDLFVGKRVLDIGTGTGVIGAFAAKCGASSVVATDVNPDAVRCAELNLKRLGYSEIVDVRLVPPEDTSAYSVIGEDEKFDIIISNPPYSLIMDESIIQDVRRADSGDLGLSIVRGLDDHLNPRGMALLLYHSLFHQQVMVKFAEHMGYRTRQHLSSKISPQEVNALFNAYVRVFLENQGLDQDLFSFDWREDPWGRLFVEKKRRYPPLLRKENPEFYPGFILLRRQGGR